MRELDFDNLSEDDKRWLISWNRGNEIPGYDPEGGGISISPEPEDQAAQAEQANLRTGDDLPDSYEDWTKGELQAELVARELPKSGNVKELIARLAEDDSKE